MQSPSIIIKKERTCSSRQQALRHIDDVPMFTRIYSSSKGFILYERHPLRHEQERYTAGQDPSSRLSALDAHDFGGERARVAARPAWHWSVGCRQADLARTVRV